MKKLVLVLGLMIFMVVFNTLTVINASERNEPLSQTIKFEKTYACFWWADNMYHGSVWFRDCLACVMNTGDDPRYQFTCSAGWE